MCREERLAIPLIASRGRDPLVQNVRLPLLVAGAIAEIDRHEVSGFVESARAPVSLRREQPQSLRTQLFGFREQPISNPLPVIAGAHIQLIEMIANE
jgi:hypothetical protein